MEDLLVILTIVFGILLFIWFKKTHIVFTTNWFWGNASIFGSCLVGGWLIATLLLTVVGKILSVVLNIAVVIAVILFCLAALYGFTILIYAFIHRKEVHSPDKPQREGFFGRLDVYTEKLWESKWFAYAMYGIVSAFLVFVVAILGGDVIRDINRTDVSSDTMQSTENQNYFSEENQGAYDYVPDEEETETNVSTSQTNNTELLDLDPFSGFWYVGNSSMECILMPFDSVDEKMIYNINISKIEPERDYRYEIGSLLLQPVDATHATATYDSDGFGHYGVIELITTPDQESVRLVVTAHDISGESPSTFSFAVDDELHRTQEEPVY